MQCGLIEVVAAPSGNAAERKIAMENDNTKPGSANLSGRGCATRLFVSLLTKRLERLANDFGDMPSGVCGELLKEEIRCLSALAAELIPTDSPNNMPENEHKELSPELMEAFEQIAQIPSDCPYAPQRSEVGSTDWMDDWQRRMDEAKYELSLATSEYRAGRRRMEWARIVIQMLNEEAAKSSIDQAQVSREAN